MLFQCWASVEDDGPPTLKQQWVNDSCLLEPGCGPILMSTSVYINISNVGLMLEHYDAGPALNYHWRNVPCWRGTPILSLVWQRQDVKSGLTLQALSTIIVYLIAF